MTDHEKIRHFESEILDKVYTQKEFFKYSDDIVIPYLLQAFGDTERHSSGLIEQGFTDSQINFFLNNMIHGISHCIRWIKSQKEPLYFSISNYDEAHKLSMDFITWGIAYNNIAQEFIAWSRGFKTAKLIEDEKKIKFFTSTDLDYSRILGNQLLHWQRYHEPFDYALAEMAHREFQQWAIHTDFSKPPIINHVNWELPKTSKIYLPFFSHLEKLIFPELSGIIDLNGYTLNQLRQFYTLFYINFLYIYTIELSIDHEKGVNHSFGSNPLYLSLEDFIHLGIKITDLPEDVVESIIHDLTFDHSEFNSRISIQPFIRSNSGTYYILPNLFLQAHPSRMMTGVLNTKNKKNVYERLINLIENGVLTRIGNAIKMHTEWIYFIGKTIKFKGKQYQPDIIIIDKINSTIVVIEYKHYISPIMAAEVINRIKELQKALLRLEDYKTVITALNSINGIDVTNYKVLGLLLTHKPLPIPLPLKINSGLTDSITFINTISGNEKRQNLMDTMNILKSKEKDLITEDFREEVEDFMVGDWTVQRTVYKN